MFSLPDIVAMNGEKKASQRKFKTAIKTGRMDGKKILCDSADEHCQGKVFVEPYFDIFSDDISGLIAQCEYHRDQAASATPEGFFYCGGCNRIYIENITWERYDAYDEESGFVLCLPCFAEQTLSDESEWLPLTDQAIDGLTFDRVRKAKHLIAVKMPIPKGIEVFDNTEMDSSSGGRLTSPSSAESSLDGAVRELQDTLRGAMAEGHSRAILILDGAYQFSVSLGVYVPVAHGRFDKPEEPKPQRLSEKQVRMMFAAKDRAAEAKR